MNKQQIMDAAPSKCSIIEYVYKLHIVDKLSTRYKNLVGQDNIEDYKQTIYCMLLEMSEQQLQSLYSRNELVYYIMAVARNQAVNPKSSFNRTYNDPNLQFQESVENSTSIVDGSSSF